MNIPIFSIEWPKLSQCRPYIIYNGRRISKAFKTSGEARKKCKQLNFLFKQAKKEASDILSNYIK